MTGFEVTTEMVLEDPDGAHVALSCGVDRVELCANLAEGGTTPTLGTLEEIVELLGSAVSVACMLRPRGGNFVYSASEFRCMLRDAEMLVARAREMAVEIDLVTGVLTVAGRLDVARMRALLHAARGARVAVHHAFDETNDLDTTLDELMELGVGRVLTSGGRRRLEDGAAALKALTTRANGRIEIMAGGEVELDRYARILRDTGVRSIHFDPRAWHPSLSMSSNAEVTYDNGGRLVADEAVAAAYLRAVRAI